MRVSVSKLSALMPFMTLIQVDLLLLLLLLFKIRVENSSRLTMMKLTVANYFIDIEEDMQRKRFRCGGLVRL